MDELLSLKWNNHCSTFIQVLCNVRNEQKYTDVTLACEGKFYSAHKIVLSSCSDYFKEIFDTTDCKSLVVLLKDIKSIELEAILDYMYIGEVNVRQTELASLIKVAECLQIKGLAVADDEPYEKSSKSKRSFSSPRPKKKRKCNENQSSCISPPAKVKASQQFITNTEKVNEKLSDCEDVKNIVIKEEDPEVFAIEDDDYLQEELVRSPNRIVAPLDTLKSLPEASSSKIDKDLTLADHSYDNMMPYNEEDSNEWLGDESNMDFPPTNYDPIDPSSSSTGVYERKYHCPICRRSFSRSDNLQVHLRTHTGEKHFSCEFCPYKAAQKKTLRYHLSSKHNISLQKLKYQNF